MSQNPVYCSAGIDSSNESSRRYNPSSLMHGLVSYLRSSLAFGGDASLLHPTRVPRRGAGAGGVARRSHIPDILLRRRSGDRLVSPRSTQRSLRPRERHWLFSDVCRGRAGRRFRQLTIAGASCTCRWEPGFQRCAITKSQSCVKTASRWIVDRRASRIRCCASLQNKYLCGPCVDRRVFTCRGRLAPRSRPRRVRRAPHVPPFLAACNPAVPGTGTGRARSVQP